ncbi:MAG: DUF4493 domain-containing protein [Alistipes sp.]|nr:DUF4493 domain-containing protein [Alistipes sp.]
MKRILAFLSAVLVLASCSKDIEPVVEMAINEGAMRFGIAMQSEIGAEDDVLVKIYKVEEEEQKLIRRYEALSDVPKYLVLLSGDYVAKVQVGERQIASFDQRYFIGEQPFTVTDGEVVDVEVVCNLLSTTVRVEYDATVAAAFNEGYFTAVAVAENYDAQAIAVGDVFALNYETTKDGYFVMPEGQTTLFWHFEGTHPVEGDIVKEAAIAEIKPGYKYTVKLKYSKDAPGDLKIEATVDVSVEEKDDTIIFSPDPTIMSDGTFELTDVQLSTTESRTYLVSSLADINVLNIEVAGDVFDLLQGNVSGVQVVKNDATNYNVVVTSEFFNNVAGGSHDLTFHIEDVDGGKANKSIVYNIQGILPLNDDECNLWARKATFKANVLNSAATSIVVMYSADGTTWNEAVATQGADGFYVAEGTDFSAGKNYTYRLKVDGVERGKALTYTTKDGVQLPNPGFEEWNDDKTPGGLWNSGNNSFVTLMTRSTDAHSGSYAAFLDSQYKMKFAAGNLFTGDFQLNISSMSGVVTFGKSFSFNASPKSFSFWMKNKQGTIDNGSQASGTDIYTAMVLITEGNRYAVDTTDESSFLAFDRLSSLPGIIAYGYVSDTDSNADWVQKTVTLNYVDGWETKTPKMVVVSFTPSGYGDYFCGSTDSEMYVDDVQFNY